MTVYDEEKRLGSTPIPTAATGDNPTLSEETSSMNGTKNEAKVPIEVDWDFEDPKNPQNWSQTRKYLVVVACCSITVTTVANATSGSIMATWGPGYFHCSRTMFLLGLSFFNISVAVTPMFLAPLSEHFGRNIIYQVANVICLLLWFPQIFSRNIHGYLTARWFQGMASSVGNSMVGGTIADMFPYHERGQVMNLFSLFVFIGQAAGGLTMGWTGQLAGMKWCYGSQAIASGVCCLMCAVILRETRANTILQRRAQKLTMETGIPHISRLDVNTAHKTIAQQLKMSALFPLKLLFTEPIVIALTLWIGFAWAIIFLGGVSTILVFQQYGFSPGEAGSIQACIAIGGIIGYITSFHQQHLYRRATARAPTGRAPPEARLYWAAIGGLIFPAATMAFAWTGRSPIHWAVPAVMLCISYWGIYSMYLGVFNYCADAYEQYSSSAQAAHSLVRNAWSGVFPLFAKQMYTAMGYPEASSLLSGLGFALAIAPFMLIKYGARLRAKSPICRTLVGDI